MIFEDGQGSVNVANNLHSTLFLSLLAPWYEYNSFESWVLHDINQWQTSLIIRPPYLDSLDGIDPLPASFSEATMHGLALITIAEETIPYWDTTQ